METLLQAIDLLALDPSSATDVRDSAEKATDDAVLKEIVDEQARRWDACLSKDPSDPERKSEHSKE